MIPMHFLFYLCIGTILLGPVIGHCTDKYKIIDSGVPEKDIKIIVNNHNHLRAMVATGKISGQPRAKNIQNLTWDDSLARKAQDIADTCVYAHVNVRDNRWYVGQNLYMEKSSQSGSKTNWEAGIQMWFDEHKSYNYGPFGYRNEDVGHYTQLIWADTIYVGCGYSFFETNERMKYQKLYVCNYGPGGNILGELPYLTK